MDGWKELAQCAGKQAVSYNGVCESNSGFAVEEWKRMFYVMVTEHGEERNNYRPLP